MENNVDEIEFYETLDEMNLAGDVDQFMAWKDGYLEVDDDFLDQVNGIYTALYDSSQSLLYGENPIAMESLEIPLENAVIRKLKVEGVLYYIFDRELEGEGLGGLWLRGVVSEEQTRAEMSSITQAFPGAYAGFADIGGHWRLHNCRKNAVACPENIGDCGRNLQWKRPEKED